MGYSEAAMAGVKANGRSWKEAIRGLPDVNNAIRVQVDKADCAGIEAGLRKIHALFAPHIDEDKASFGVIEALEWFEHESPRYEIEEDTLHEWVQEFDFRLGELYDYADYNRIWVDPAEIEDIDLDRDVANAPSPG